MSATRRAIEQAINAGEKRLAKIDEILHGNHISKVMDIRRKANEILKGKEDHATKARLLGPLAKAEKAEMAAFRRQNKHFQRLFQEQIRIDSDLRDLQTNLSRLNLRRELSQ